MYFFTALATSILALTPVATSVPTTGSGSSENDLHRRDGNAQCGQQPAAALPAADIAAAFGSLEKNYCNSNTTGWPIKPNMQGSGRSGAVMAYVCNPGGAAVQYCRSQDLADARAAIARSCGADMPGYAWTGGMIGFVDADSDQPYCQSPSSN